MTGRKLVENPVGRVAARLKRLVQKGLLVPYHLFLGVFQFRHRNLGAAERHFLRVRDIEPGHFTARMYLGRIYYSLDDFFRAEEEWYEAQRIDPRRFRRDRLPEDFRLRFEEGEDVEEDVFGPDPTEEPTFLTAEPDEEARPVTRRFRRGDFSSYEEYLRFKNRPPISADEIRRVDWDRLLSDRIDG
jgi:tetratricopeptide (TPR) repeat protein